MWSSAPKPDVAVTVNEKSPLQTSALRDERNPFSQQWSQNVKLLGDYCRNALTGDVIAGITVASVLVPQSMAYALLAGLPPEMGLYSALLPLVAYAAFGSSPHLAVGPVSVVCVLIAVQMSEMNLPEEEGPMISIMMALMAGVVLCLLGVAKLGFVACLLSHAVLSGFMTAVAFIIAIEQLDTFLGFKVDVPHGQFAAKVVAISTHLRKTNPYALGLGVATALILLGSTQLQKRMPKAIWPRATTLVLTIVGTVVSYVADLPSHGVAVVGELPAGLPQLALPVITPSRMTELLPSVAMLVLVGFVESIAVAKTIAAKVGYEIDADRELIGLGLSNIASALSGGFPSFGSLSRTPVNYITGASTRFAGVVTALLVLLVVLFLTPLLRYMPKPVMAAIIIVAVSKMADFAEFAVIWKQRKAEVALWLLPFLGTLVIGIDAGLLGSLAVCTLLVINHASLAHATLQIAAAGKASEDEYVDRYIFASQQPPPVMHLENKRVRQMCTPALETLHEVQDPSLGCCYGGGRSAQAAQLTSLMAGYATNGLPLLRLQSPLFYANAAQVRNAIEVIAYTLFPVAGHGEGGLAPPSAILVHMHAVTSIDSSAVHILEQACDAIKTAGDIQLAVVAVKPAVLKALTVSGLVKPGGGGRILAFDSVDKAATYFLKAQ